MNSASLYKIFLFFCFSVFLVSCTWFPDLNYYRQGSYKLAAGDYSTQSYPEFSGVVATIEINKKMVSAPLLTNRYLAFGDLSGDIYLFERLNGDAVNRVHVDGACLLYTSDAADE